MSKASIKNILIVRTDRIGDVVLTTPVFKALRKAYPLARICVLLTASTVDLVRGNPYVDEVMIDERKGRHQGLFGSVLLAREIRRKHFDVAIIFHTKRRYNWACFAAGIPQRIGFKNDKFGFLLTHPIKDQRHLGLKHEVQYCLEVLNELGIADADQSLFVPVDKMGESWVNAWMGEHDVRPQEFIAIHPGASDQTKCWPASNFADLINRLNERYALKIVLIGGPDAKVSASEILKLTPKSVLDLTGQTSISQTTSLLRRCRLLISNDSGPVHIGSAVDINVVSLFLRDQPGINPQRWRPLGDKSHVIANKAGQEIKLNAQGQVCSGQKDSISVPDVLNIIEDIFQKDSQTFFHW